MARVRVPVRGSIGKAVQTGGSTTVNQTTVVQNVAKGGAAGVGGIAATIWPLVAQIPVPVLDLAALSTSGLTAFDGTDLITRALAVDPKLTITDPTGAAGNPTIGFAVEAANSVLAGPSSGVAAGPTFRALVTSDLPSLAAQGLSVALADVSTNPLYGISGSPITGAGTLDITLLPQAALKVFAGPLTGSAAPTFRSLATSDIPTLPATQISGLATVAMTGMASDISGLATVATTGLYSDLTGKPTIPADISGLTYLTTADETASAPNSVRLLAGTNVAFDDTVPNQRTINASGGGGSGTVTSVGIADLSSTPIYAVSTAPITTTGTLDITLLSQSALKVLAGPLTGSAQPTFRSLVTSDIPTLPAAQISGLAPVATTGAYSDLTGEPTIPTGANPTAKVGPTATNGSATTYMRSDGAPAIDLTASYSWTGAHGWTASGSTAITIGGNGNSSGVADLRINRTASAATAENGPSVLLFDSGATRGALMQYGGGAFRVWTFGGVTFTDRLDISTAGNVTVNTPDSGTGITASGVASQFAAVFNGASSSGSSRGVHILAGTTSADYCLLATNQGNTVDLLTVKGNGGLNFGAYGAGALTTDASGNVTATSDRRIKRKVRPFRRGLEALKGLEPVLHGYTKKSGLDQSHNDYAGFIAQNVKAHIPEAVGEMPDGLLTLSDRPIIAALVNAVKELSAEVAALKEKLK